MRREWRKRGTLGGGTRGGEGYERGKHDEATNYGGGWNKGVLLVTGWLNTWREMLRKFGKYGNVKDIFISRKPRKSLNCPFASVRFEAYEATISVIDRLNGQVWGDRKVMISMSKFTRNGAERKNLNQEGRHVAQGEQDS
ncbi:hypothetical protein PIB30_004955 [Stylosanthes scabra]|uniref:RRM domain-containing protein n=1 Tax=Stylosanthes scabra TaxID=79078 RepID=A0ABU6X3D9_9FABA|nr:hypothetical protein [Stylosanthes scabra]